MLPHTISKMNNKPIAIIGSGVIGLTSAVRLLEQGFSVTIYARETPPHTTSDVAAAYWAPGALLGGERMRRWALESLAAFTKLAETPGSGVRFNLLYELSTEPLGVPDLGPLLHTEAVPPGRFPAPWSGFGITVPQIDVPVYMPWLFQQVHILGGQLVQADIRSLAELAGAHRLVVNCTGLGAHMLTGDDLFPIRGQVIRIRKPPSLPGEMLSAESHNEVTYIIPRSQDCLLGGTYHYGDARIQIDEEIAAGILTRCARFYPVLAEPDIIEHRVGLRPGRRAVRLEVERLGQGISVVHNYGHAALGHTLSWGCAAEVAALVQSQVN
ncbi:MAG: FAD-binding oxidoreductase [Chloroflexi bacterium]|nr:MAG: FAD-binding oxidoreductase [Chloroflexota bacterium]